MSVRKPVVAWVVRYPDFFGEATSSKVAAEQWAAEYNERHDGISARVVRLVEHDPKKEAVVKAAARWMSHPSWGDANGCEVKLRRAVSRYLSKPKARRKR